MRTSSVFFKEIYAEAKSSGKKRKSKAKATDDEGKSRETTPHSQYDEDKDTVKSEEVTKPGKRSNKRKHEETVENEQETAIQKHEVIKR